MLWVRVTPLDGELAVTSHWVVMILLESTDVVKHISVIVFILMFVGIMCVGMLRDKDGGGGGGGDGGGSCGGGCGGCGGGD